MCRGITKVADRRPENELGNRENESRTPPSGDELLPPAVIMEDSNDPAMYAAYARPGEMSAIVSALTHVVSSSTLPQISSQAFSSSLPYSFPSFSSASGSGIWLGQKRGRLDEGSSSSSSYPRPSFEDIFAMDPRFAHLSMQGPFGVVPLPPSSSTDLSGQSHSIKQ